MAKKVIKAQMAQRRDTKANWAAQNPVLLAGEIGIVSDDPNLYKVGDGATAWNALPFRGFDGTITHEMGESENSVMSQKVVSQLITKTQKHLQSLDSSLDLYRQIEDQQEALSYTDIQGRISAYDGTLLITSANWDARLYAVKEGEEVRIRTDQLNPYSANYAQIAWIPEYIDGVKGEVIRTMENSGLYEGLFTPQYDGYIYVLCEISGTSYVSGVEILTNKKRLIDYGSEVAELKSTVEKLSDDLTDGLNKKLGPIITNVDNLTIRVNSSDEQVKALDSDLNIYRIEGDEQISVSYDEVQGRVGAADLMFIIPSSNWDARLYAVKSGQTYTIHTKQIKAFSPNFAQIAWIPEYKDGVEGLILKDMSVVGEFDSQYTPNSDGFLLVQYRVSGVDYVSDIQISVKTVGGAFRDFGGEIDDMQMQLAVLDKTVVGNNPEKTASVSGNVSSYTDMYFEGPSISEGLTITNIEIEPTDGYSVNGYFIKPDGTYVVVELISSIAGKLPYILPSECGGIKLIGNGSIKITYSDGTTAIKGLLDQVRNLELIVGTPIIHVPDKIDAVLGETLQIFYEGIIESVNIDGLYIRINGEGSSYPRYHEVTPTSVGDKPMILEIYNGNAELISSKRFIMSVATPPAQPIETKRIAFFGDSLTEPGVYPQELNRLLTSSDPATDIFPAGKNLRNIELIGLMEKSGSRYYGVGGWGWSNYATNTDAGLRFYSDALEQVKEGDTYTINGCSIIVTSRRLTDMSFSAKLISGVRDSIPDSGTFANSAITYTSVADDTANPLWDANSGDISFKHYFEQSDVTGDVAMIAFLLGWNTLYLDMQNDRKHVVALINKAHYEYPNTRFCLIGLQCPSLNGGLANNYKNDAFFGNKQKVIKRVHLYNEWLKKIANEFDFVDYIDIASQFDSLHNMPETEKNVNLRNPKKEIQGNNGVHPANNGYYQIADVLYRYITANLL